MSNLDILFKNIADSIRNKKETTGEIIANTFPSEIDSIETVNGEEVVIEPTTSTQEIVPSGDKNAILKATVNPVTNAIDANIIPENIKKDITILGVTGTMEEGSGEGSGEGVKLFSTMEEMNAVENVQLGDMGCVYGIITANWTATTIADKAMFPATVVLPSAVTDGVYCSLRAMDGGWFDCQVELSSTEFRMFYYGDTADGEITYTSTDGITYTKSDGIEQVVEFGTNIGCYYAEEWDDILGYFMYTQVYNFGGLFSGQDDLHNTMMYNFRLENDELVYDIREYDRDYYMDIIGAEQEIQGSATIMPKIVDGEIIGHFRSGYGGSCIVKYNNKLYYGFGPTTGAWSDYLMTYEALDNVSSKNYAETELTKVTMSDGTLYLIPESEMADDENALYFEISSSPNAGGTLKYITGTTYKSITFYKNQGNMYVAYKPVPTQFTAESTDVFEKEFLGVNGAEIGSLGDKVSIDCYDTPAKVFIKLQEAYNNLTPIAITSVYDIPEKLVMIPTKLDGTPLYDTSALTSAQSMFTGNDIIYMPKINTSNVTNMYYMFNGCDKLIAVEKFDTSKTTDMYGMFFGCESLVTVPQFDVSKATRMYNAFYSCTSLSDESLNNILGMCANVTSAYTDTKTLYRLSLTKEQATKCTTLSNWSAASAKGWTTGY